MNIGKYEVLSELGHGAMGTVYKARDPRLDRLVAIKLVMRSALHDPKLVTMFEKEARSIARLSHPNIVTIFEFDYSEQQPYIVMELLKGADLTGAEHVHDMSIARKLDLVRQVCEGLAHAHEQEIIHRDIKPANIYLTETGTVKITDFGIARLSSGTMTTGSIMGTPEFMAPERLSTGKTDHRSDLFSTGVVLYWILSGIRPFSADDINAVFFRILNQVPPDLALTGISEQQVREVNSILSRSLAKDPQQRYESAAAMAADLRKLEQWITLGTQPVLPAATQPSQEIPKTVRVQPGTPLSTQPDKTIRTGIGDIPRSRRRPALVAASLVLATVAIFGGYRYMQNQNPDASMDSRLNAVPGAGGARVEIGIVTGKEKQRWVELYAKKFQSTDQGAGVQINTFTRGSLDAFRSVVDGDRRIHVWAPASDLQEDLFVQQWTAKHNKSPILEVQNLALTPMVFLIWEERHQAFTKKYGELSFPTISRAMQEKGGWGTVVGKPEWGVFKFGFSDPYHFNSGLVMLLIMSHEYHKSPGLLTDGQIRDQGLVDWMRFYKTNGSGLKNESKDLVDEMIGKGPSFFDAIFTYESLALRAIKEAEGRWGKVRLVYPGYNFWMDHPYYVLDVPWSTEEQRTAARNFMRYLYSPHIQKGLLTESVRPSNPEIPLLDPGSPFFKFKQEKIVMDIPNALDEPRAAIVSAMLENWSSLKEGQ